MVSNAELLDEVSNVQQSSRRKRRFSDVNRVSSGVKMCPKGQCLTAIDPRHSICKPCTDSWLKAEGEGNENDNTTEAATSETNSRILGMKPINAVMLGVGIVAVVLIIKKFKKG